MGNLKEIFEKQGGIGLIKQYWKSGVFFTAVGEFLLLGKSKTALELLRLSTHLKAKQKLQKKYKKKLLEFDKDWQGNLLHEGSNKVWICWFQGLENAPELVKQCYASVVENMPERDVVLITNDNIQEYVDFPNYIVEKWKKGQITHTHMTDLLRLELLIRYGGVWLDATVFCSGADIPEYMLNSDLFFFQCLKPGRDGHSHITSSWMMSAKTNNKILMAVRELCYEYWKEHSSLIDYFLLHDFIAIVLEYYPDEWLNIVPRDNATPHILYLRLFEQYNETIWNSIKGQTPFHKLSYKYKTGQDKIVGTYYDVLFGRRKIDNA